jgi:hypothetical protein
VCSVIQVAEEFITLKDHIVGDNNLFHIASAVRYNYKQNKVIVLLMEILCSTVQRVTDLKMFSLTDKCIFKVGVWS